MITKAQIDNYALAYHLEGDASHPAILFLHGFMGDRLEFEQAIAVLSKQFYCIAIDLPAHGLTDVTDQHHSFTMQSTASAVIKLLDLFNIDHCFLVGYSMGGRLGLYLTLHFPQYFHKVILESASAGLLTTQSRGDRLVKDHQLATELEKDDFNFRLFLENWYQQPIFATLRSHPNFWQLLERRLNNSPIKLAKSLRNLSIGLQPSLWEMLSKNQVPLLLLAGSLDPKFVQINQQMEQTCKFAKLEIMPNCGHNTHFENSDLFAKKVQTFFLPSKS